MNNIGIIAKVFDKIFYGLKFLPPQIFVEERTKHQNRLPQLSKEDRKQAIKKRLKCTELIIAVYAMLYVGGLIFTHFISSTNIVKYIFLGLLTLRLIDIIQVNVNILLFDNIRIDNEKAPVFIYSSIRSIVLVSLNFLEIAIIFGFYYSLIQPENFSIHKITTFNCFYFSFITQLTIGYGDIIPFGFNKLLSVSQGLLGYFFTILILSRFIGLLPSIKSENNSNADNL